MFTGRQKVFHIFHSPNNNSFLKKNIYTVRVRRRLTNMSDLNFRINKDVFYKALQTVNGAVASSSPIPTMSGIEIEANQDMIVLTGSDNDISIRSVIKNDKDNQLFFVEEPGTIVVDHNYILDMVKNLDSDEVQVQNIDGTLTQFTGNNVDFKINGFNPSDYPAIDFNADTTPFTIKASEFNDAAAKTSFAAANKETRPVLMGINLKSENSRITFTATDSFRLARYVLSAEVEPFNITIPSKTIGQVKSIFADGDISISVSARKIVFVQNGVTLQSNLLEGAFPDIERLIPSSFSRKLVVNRSALLMATARPGFIKTDNMTIIRMQINSADDIVVTSRSQEIGESHENLQGVVSYEGDPLDISCSANYLSDAVRSLNNENVTVLFTSEMKPFILKNDEDDQKLLQLVLPVRTYN